MLSAQVRFEAALPHLRLIIARYFRSYYNQDDKDDAIAEAIALSWRRFRAWKTWRRSLPRSLAR